jgi:DNA topoisomerase-1
LYIEGTDSDEPQSTNPLPELTVGDVLNLLNLIPEQHFTEPPPRYNEATLIKALEANGIGRPSTYAPILGTIQERGYVAKNEARLQPTDLGYVVNDLLIDNFPDVLSVDFTAQMEEELDDIARGERSWQPVVQEYYKPLEKALSTAEDKVEAVIEETEETCDKCGRPMIIRWGRHGRFLACSGFPECRNTKPIDGEEEPVEQPTELCPECNSPMVVKRGRFGPFLACSRYPDCKGTRPILDKVGVDCPQCGGDIVVRRGRRGRIFYGCSNYPTCNFSVWGKPLEQPCPQCGGLLLNDGQNKARCHNCDWRGEAPEPAPAKAAAAS